MKSILIAAVATIGPRFGSGRERAGGPGQEQWLPQLPRRDATKKMGPSFKSVAEKYKGKADAEATLVAKLKSGTGHPAEKASDDDLKSLVKWVLSM